jgi:hypothetical protein
MINKVTYKDEPTLFDEISEFSIDSDMDHRRGSNFYRTDIIELTLEHKKYFPEIEDFEKYIGTWQTDQVIWDDNYGFDDTYSELTRVKQVEKITHEWVTVE